MIIKKGVGQYEINSNFAKAEENSYDSIIIRDLKTNNLVCEIVGERVLKEKGWVSELYIGEKLVVQGKWKDIKEYFDKK